ncbi:MAG: CDP-diacylglycerol--serine O-phosphatidyltransferase [Acidobacteria bacterium]|nr:CDP-diacylglycerol--serine O-phosphatidyltransferase [Acidobacteriota bacterium]MBI3422885.1 CDP-diacylglycerol--serine O-phosphatidyltransferase [Acidobacteriota bacterium]
MTNTSETNLGNPPRRGIRKGIYIIPSAFTIGNILCGFYAVINSAKAFQNLAAPEAAHLFDKAAIAIGVAVLFDGLDGRIARMTKTTSEFGVELDSIADVVTFGVAPAVLAYTWGYGSTIGLEKWSWAISFFFLICGALRLARFNVMARSPKFAQPGNTPKLDKRYFVGLPIPPAAGMLAAVVHFAPLPIAMYSPPQKEFLSWSLLAGMGFLAVLMVSTLRYTSFKDIGFQSNKPFIALPLFSLLLALIWFHSQLMLLVLSFGYVIHGPLLKLLGLFGRLRQPSKSKTNEASGSIEV